MIRKWVAVCVVFAAFIFPQAVSAEQPKVEVFQIETGKVIRSTLKPPSVQKEAEKSIASITGLYKKVSPLPKKGYLVKIPLDPAVKIENSSVNTLASEVIFVLEPNQKPIMMVFDNENRTYFFEFTHDLTLLRKALQL
ncbi:MULTISPECIES: hypothetical protein [Priestia]|uniref:hypothetical protein n=1 Tax=Priestia TaxID=2800373 RepID=UPI002040E3F0|nr:MULTISPECIES: hypothetical protein [Priestia]MCM3770551.1 hypothetical protein [Priestia aryabhattai]MDY0940919.1 hypothetical protein [Priestia megaterium]